MKVVWMAMGAIGGLAVGSIAGFGIALTLAKPRFDGSFGMREILVGLPTGALLGLIGGIILVHRLVW